MYLLGLEIFYLCEELLVLLHQGRLDFDPVVVCALYGIKLGVYFLDVCFQVVF